MSATETARIEMEIGGDDQVAAKTGKLVDTFTAAEKKIGGALKTVGSALGGLAQDGLRAAGVLQTISLAAAVDEARKLDAVTARLGQSAGISGTRLKESFEGAEKRALTSAPAIAEFAKQLGRATYDARGSTEALTGLSDEALATGRTLEEELALGTALRTGLGVIGDTTSELDRLREMAERTAQTGGHVAFKDSIAALQPLLAGVATDSDQARAKVEALMAVLGKGLKPEAARAAGAAALTTIRSRALDIERATGRRVLDDNNQLIDPTANLKDLKRLAERRFGKNREAMRRALISDFGADLGLAVYRTDLNEVDQVAASKGRGKTAAEAEAFRRTKEGKRLEQQVEKDAALRAAGDKLLGLHDGLVGALGTGGALAVELGGGSIGMKAAGPVLKSAGSAVVGALGATATAGAAATLGFTVGGLVEMGKSSEEDGREWRSKNGNADLIGQGMARKALQAGEITPDILRMGQGDKEATAAMLVTLEKKMDQLNDTLRYQVAQGIAAELRRAPMKVTLPSDPNGVEDN